MTFASWFRPGFQYVTRQLLIKTTLKKAKKDPPMAVVLQFKYAKGP